jgi:hypothetical protein
MVVAASRCLRRVSGATASEQLGGVIVGVRPSLQFAIVAFLAVCGIARDAVITASAGQTAAIVMGGATVGIIVLGVRIRLSDVEQPDEQFGQSFDRAPVER